MTVKELLKVTFLNGDWQTRKFIDEDHSEEIGYFTDTGMAKFNDWEVRYLQPGGYGDMYIEIEEVQNDC